MNEQFKKIFKEELRKELTKEFEDQLGLTINQNELKKVIKDYKKIKKFQKTPLYQVIQMDKKNQK
jgi:hypothetical protein